MGCTGLGILVAFAIWWNIDLHMTLAVPVIQLLWWTHAGGLLWSFMLKAHFLSTLPSVCDSLLSPWLWIQAGWSQVASCLRFVCVNVHIHVYTGIFVLLIPTPNEITCPHNSRLPCVFMTVTQAAPPFLGFKPAYQLSPATIAFVTDLSYLVQ